MPLAMTTPEHRAENGHEVVRLPEVIVEPLDRGILGLPADSKLDNIPASLIESDRALGKLVVRV